MISIIVPAYNAAATLPACLRALQNQTTPSSAYEIIVVDDGSTDDTAGIAKAFGTHVLRQTRRGPAAARNLGTSVAQGEIIMFTDADCCPDKGWIEQMSASLQDETIAGVKGAYATRQTETVARLAQLEFEERYARLLRSRYGDFFDSHALALRNAVLKTLGDFDTFFPVANNEDVDLAYRLAERGCRLVFNPKAIVYHRHPSRWRQYMRQKFWRGYWRMQVYQRYPRKLVADSYTPQTLKLQALLMLLIIAVLPLLLISPTTMWLVAVLGFAWALSGFGLYRLAWRRDRALLPWVPLFLACRALAVGLGSVLGALTIMRIMPLLMPRQMMHEHTRLKS